MAGAAIADHHRHHNADDDILMGYRHQQQQQQQQHNWELSEDERDLDDEEDDQDQDNMSDREIIEMLLREGYLQPEELGDRQQLQILIQAFRQGR
jgi:hypothetical protein